MLPFFEDRKEVLSVFPFQNNPYPEHLHRHVEIMYIEQGTRRLKVDRHLYTLQAGDLAVIFPNTVHCYPEQDESCSGYMILFDPSMQAEFQRALFSTQPESPLVPFNRLHPDVGRCVRALSGTEPAPVRNAYVHLLLARIFPVLALRPIQTPPQTDILTLAIRYISQHYIKPLSLAAVAKALGVNAYYLSHVFSQRMGVGFRTYLNALRIALAQQLLQNTQQSVTHICFECGFENLRTFDRVFAAQMGCSPRAFRAQAGTSAAPYIQ